jgi:hypothetical protein
MSDPKNASARNFAAVYVCEQDVDDQWELAAVFVVDRCSWSDAAYIQSAKAGYNDVDDYKVEYYAKWEDIKQSMPCQE